MGAETIVGYGEEPVFPAPLRFLFVDADGTAAAAARDCCRVHDADGTGGMGR